MELINKLMQWSSFYDLHIHCVLHLNKGDDNVRGHIGTELNNKAETVLVISKSSNHPEVSEVRSMHIRDKDFMPFAFQISEDGLPEAATGYSFEEVPKRNVRTNFRELPLELHQKALENAFKGKPIKGFENAVQALCTGYASIGFERGRSVMVKLLQYLTDELKLITKRDKCFYYGETETVAGLFDDEVP